MVGLSLAASQIHVAHTKTGACAIAEAQATAVTESPTSNVPGKVFDRIMMVQLETTSFGNATSDRADALYQHK